MADAVYDLAVIGSGPAGQKAAIAAAKLGKKVAVVDRQEMVGGVCLHTGTIPSKTLREAILYLSGFRERSFYGKDYAVKQDISVADLAFRVQKVRTREMEVIRAQLKRNHVITIDGTGRFQDPHTLAVKSTEGETTVRAEHFLIACGTRPAHSASVPIDGKRVIDSDQLRQVDRFPSELIVVGAGVIGLEYASMFAALNIKVTIIEQRPTMLDYADREIIEALTFFMRQRGATFRLGEKVVSVENESGQPVVANLESGKRVRGDAVLYAVGRQTNADLLDLPAAGLSADERGRLKVNEFFQTSVPHIYAAGDVIGFPALASTSAEQGRIASCHMFGVAFESRKEAIPYGIYTIPEISMVGKTEQELTAAKIPYEIGLSRFEELAKGQMLGTETGMLKILFDPKSLKVLGVHAMGESATEIVHIGQAVLSLGGTIEYFRDTVFNYPTFAEAYKVAGLDGLNRVSRPSAASAGDR
jgi:NAD(P) transhydrogenase